MARFTCVFTVAGLRYSRSAMSSLDSPSATSAVTSRSRFGEHVELPGRRRLRPVANSPMSCRVTFGDSSASPAATTRTARSSSTGSVSFTRKPLAPCRTASKMYSSSSKVVRMMIRTEPSRGSPAIAFVASRPSSPGIRMSIRTTSGRARVPARPPRRRRRPRRRPRCRPRRPAAQRTRPGRGPDRRPAGPGSRPVTEREPRRTRKPPPARGAADSVPPSAVARSLIPVIPLPGTTTVGGMPSSSTSTTRSSGRYTTRTVADASSRGGPRW